MEGELKVGMHSRSSSEIEPIRYNEVLPIFLREFLKDFEFADVKHKVKDLFTKRELELILEEEDEQRQVVCLFWILYSKEDVIRNFLKSIQREYKWLVDMVLHERNEPSKETERYVDKLKSLRSKHQDYTRYNVHRIDLYMKLRAALKKLKPHHKVVLLGDLGSGKKWLALDVCTEFSVLRDMKFEVFWIDMSSCLSPEEDLRALQQLYLMLNDLSSRNNTEQHFDSISNRILALQQHLKARFQEDKYKNSLLILENVRNVIAWQRFNFGCKMLIITRNKKVSESLSPDMCELINTDVGLTQCEFFMLFEKILGDKLPSNATDIYTYSNGHPYLLSIIAQNLYKNKAGWDEWIRNLRHAKITDNKFTMVVETSLNVLSSDLLELYATFSIFAHSISIPVNLLATLWQKTLNQAADIVDKFHQYSLVNKEFLDDNTMVCTIPFIYSSHLKSSKSIQNMINATELHKAVVQYYNIDEILHSRTEVNFCDQQHDLYFFCCIGYHLLEAQRTELFSQIYLDFGFLEHKMRTVGLLNTLGDLKFYEKEIIYLEPRHGQLLDSICEFLPKVEEKLVHSKDTCLLQYALTASGPVYEEALRQAKQFPDKVWFSEKGNFHQRRQIVNLPTYAKTVIYLEQDICLIVLSDSSMVLVDISLDCSNDPILLIKDNRYGDIRKVLLFKSNKYILTLHNQGELKLWSIAEVQRRSLIHRRSSKQMVNPLNIKHLAQYQTKRYKQCFNESVDTKRGKIVAFHVEEWNGFHLHVAFDSGDICVFGWNDEREEFEFEYIPVLHTQIRNIRILSTILHKYHMVLNASNSISFWNFEDSSKAPNLFEWPEHKSSLICHEIFEHYRTNQTNVYFVFGNKVLRLKLRHLKLLEGELETIYEYGDAHTNTIRCAKLSRDEHLLVLGTRSGLIVIDTHSKLEILRGNISETISCVDIYDLDDRIYKYTIICGSEQKRILNILALRKTGDNGIGWAHNVSCIGNQETKNPQLEPSVWLLGQKLYDISYNEGTLLVAVDSKNRIHQVCTTNTKNWSIVRPPETRHPITAITATQSNVFAGYENGDIFNVSEEVSHTAFKEAIVYMEILSDHFVIAASRSETVITLVNDLDKCFRIKFSIRKCYLIFEHYLLLLNHYGDILILNAKDDNFVCDEKIIRDVSALAKLTISGCDLKNSHLFLVTSTYDVHAYGLYFKNESLTLSNHSTFSKRTDGMTVTCLAASADANFLAIGLANGDIEVFKVHDIKNIAFLYKLQSHTKQIYDLKFSPNNDVLVSCSEQLCFWSVAFMLNNSLGMQSTKRRSSRFYSKQNSVHEEVDASLVHSNGNLLQIHDEDLKLKIALRRGGNMDCMENPWQHKRGPHDKPELLACIKFDGNKAEKIYANSNFTQFNTIDDEGVYYHLTLLDFSTAIDHNDIISTQSSSPCHRDMDYDNANYYGNTITF